MATRVGGRPRVFSERAKRLTFKLEPETHDVLRLIQRRFGSEQSVVLGEALRAYEKKTRRKIPGT